MDEQATPGLFSGSGGGSLRAPQAPAEAARAQYHVPGILHFLRHEWARFEVERAQWEVERAELQVGAHTASIIGQPEVFGGGGGGGGGVSASARFCSHLDRSHPAPLAPLLSWRVCVEG